MNFDQQVDVVIVGAGPAGLTAACVLQAKGASVLVLDAAAEGSNTSRAAVIHARTLEVLESIDVTARLMAEGVVVPLFTVRDRSRILVRLDFASLRTRYPFTLMLPQSRTEQILSTRLRELGGEVHRLNRFTAVRQTGDRTLVTVVSENGAEQQLRAKFVIGADGMHSSVRESVGIDFPGSAYDQSFVLADVVMDWPLAGDEVQLFFSPAGLVVVAPLPGGHHRIVATVDTAREHPTLEEIQTLLIARGPEQSQVKQVIWSSRFRVQHRIASAYRSGTVFLVGDAAHVHSPAGGQGMNTGIQDAIDLANVLGQALTGKSAASDLDGYQRRRRPIAQGVVSLTDRMTRLATMKAPVARGLRNVAIKSALQIPPLRRALAMRIAELK